MARSLAIEAMLCLQSLKSKQGPRPRSAQTWGRWGPRPLGSSARASTAAFEASRNCATSTLLNSAAMCSAVLPRHAAATAATAAAAPSEAPGHYGLYGPRPRRPSRRRRRPRPGRSWRPRGRYRRDLGGAGCRGTRGSRGETPGAELRSSSSWNLWSWSWWIERNLVSPCEWLDFGSIFVYYVLLSERKQEEWKEMPWILLCLTLSHCGTHPFSAPRALGIFWFAT